MAGNIEDDPNYIDFEAPPPPSAVDQVIAANQNPAAPQEVDPIPGMVMDGIGDASQYTASPFDPKRWGDVVEPSALPAPPGQPGQPKLKSVSGGVSRKVSWSGTPGQGKGAFAEANAATTADNAREDDRFNAEAANYQRDTTAQGDAIREQGRLETEHYDKLREINARRSAYNKAQAEMEQRIEGEGRVVRQKVLGEYTQQLAAVRALGMTTGNPLPTLSTGAKGALGAAMFAQGFLAAQGIHIDVAGQVDKWVDRSIQERQMQINNARESANDTLHLYDIARQSSQDDYEARQRYRGFVIQGFQDEINKEASRFQSALAMSSAAEKNATLQLELDKTMSAIGDRRQAAHVQNATLHLNEARAKVDAQHQAATLAEERRHNKATEENAANKNKGKLNDNMLIHPGQVVRDDKGNITGVKYAYSLKNPEKGLNPETQKAATGYAQAKSIIDQAKKLRVPAQDEFLEKFGPEAGKKLYSEAYRAYRTQADLLGEQMIYALTGAAAPEQQMDRIRQGLKDDSIFGENSQGLDIIDNFFKDRFEGAMASDPNVHVLSADERKILDDNGMGTSSVVGDSEASAQMKARFEGGAPTTTPVQGAVAQGFGRDSSAVDQEGISTTFKRYLESNPDAYLSHTSNYEQNPGLTRGQVGIDHLAAIALKPELAGDSTVDGSDASSLDKRVKEAEASIKRVSNGGFGGPDAPITAGYADFMLGELEKVRKGELSPDELYGQLGLTSGDWLNKLDDQRTQKAVDAAPIDLGAAVAGGM